jgi:hypothetical protein
MSLLLIGAAVGGLIGLAQGANNANVRQAEYDDKLEDLNRQKAILDKQYTQSQQSYDLSKDQLNESTDYANTELNLLGDQTIKNRDTSLNQTATIGAKQSEINALQIATLDIQNKQQVGSANQAAATSGFRGSGSALNVLNNTRTLTQDARKQATMQSNLSNYSTFASAVNNFTNANQQHDAYMRKIDENEFMRDQQLESMNLQMEQTKDMYDLQGGYLASDIEYMDGEGRDALKTAQAFDILGGIFSGAVSGGTLGSKIKTKKDYL